MFGAVRLDELDAEGAPLLHGDRVEEGEDGDMVLSKAWRDGPA
jgi:hypothetical protein